MSSRRRRDDGAVQNSNDGASRDHNEEAIGSGNDAGFGHLNIRKNFLVLFVEAAGRPLGNSFLSPETVLPMFVALLSKSNSAVGLVVAIQGIAQIAVQVLAANRVERVRRKSRLLVVFNVFVGRLPFLVVAAVVFLPATHSVVFPVFLVCWVLANMSIGLSLPTYFGLYATTIPPALRGRLTGTAGALGKLFAVAGASITAVILSRAPGTYGFGWLFVIGFAILTLTVIPVMFADEPPASATTEVTKTFAYIRGLPSILRRDREFAGYVLVQAIMLFLFATAPFITSYAALKLGAPTASVGVATALLMISSMAGNVVFGLLADRRGYRSVLMAGACVAIVTYGVLATSPPMGVVWICYFLAGLFMSACQLGNNMAMEFGTRDKAVTHSTITFAAGAPMRSLGPLLLGVVADRASISVVFVSIMLVAVAALLLAAFRLHEPRRPTR